MFSLYDALRFVEESVMYNTISEYRYEKSLMYVHLELSQYVCMYVCYTTSIVSNSLFFLFIYFLFTYLFIIIIIFFLNISTYPLTHTRKVRGFSFIEYIHFVLNSETYFKVKNIIKRRKEKRRKYFN